jgi:hypothetical protein
MTVSMDTAARAIDALLHRGYAEERDGGVWIDDLGAQYLESLRWVVEERDELVNEVARLDNLNDDMRRDRDEAVRLCRRVLDVLDNLAHDADGEELNEVIGTVLTILEPARLGR